MRSNFVFCGDVVPRLAGNTEYVKTIIKMLEEENKTKLSLARVFLPTKMAAVLNPVEEMFSPSGILTFLGQYKHCSHLIYYAETETKDDAKYT